MAHAQPRAAIALTCPGASFATASSRLNKAIVRAVCTANVGGSCPTPGSWSATHRRYRTWRLNDR